MIYMYDHVESTKFTNKEFRNARNYYNLYDNNVNTKWKDLKDKERLGIRRVNNLPPLDADNGFERRSASPSLLQQQAPAVHQSKVIQRNQDGQVGIVTNDQISGTEQSPILMQMLLAKTRPVLKKSSLLH